MTNTPQTDPRRLDRRLRIAGWSTVAVLMLLPLTAMQFTDEVAWTTSDFVFAGAVLGGVGLILELTFRLTDDWFYRGGVAVALAGGVLTVWANGAVGIIGDEGNPANMMFYWLLAVGLLGVVLARFKARGMAWAMVATAIAQGAVTAIALGLGLEVPLAIMAVFAALWLTSAWLFARAAPRQGAAAAAS